MRKIRRDKLVARCARMGELLQKKLAPLRELPAVGDVRGLGLLAGVEFVADKKTKAPFPRSERFAETFVAQALAQGLVVWPNVGHADGTNGDLIMVAPPFVVSESELDEIAGRLSAALAKTVEVRHVRA